MNIFKKPIGFEWDKGNKDKNWLKHRVTDYECEEVFFDRQKRILEARYILLGQTKKQRTLFIVFTIRKDKVRIISARDLNKKERNLYEQSR